VIVFTPAQTKPGRPTPTPVALHEIQELVLRIDHDGAGTFVAMIFDLLLVESRIHRPLHQIAILPVILFLARHLLHFIAGLRLVERLARIAALLIGAPRGLRIAEQEFDQAAAHAGTLGISGAHRRRRLRLAGVDRLRWAVECCRGIDGCGEAGRADEQRKRSFSEHRRTLYCFVCKTRERND